jgi:glycosyltransferase involved in cell wall biosynthesis
MKILVFAHDSELYGASQSLITALELLKQVGNEFLILQPYSGKLTPVLERMNLEYRTIQFPHCAVHVKGKHSLLRKLRDFRNYHIHTNKMVDQLIAIVQEFRPDIIYTNTSVVSIGYKIACRLNIPHVWHIREFGWPDYRYLPSRQTVVNAIRKSAGSIFISQSVQDYWLKQKKGSSTIIYNGIVSGRIATEARKLPIGPVNIGITAVILRSKGQHVAIQAFHQFLKHYPNSFLQVYGGVSDQAYSEELQTLCRKLQIESRVCFNGFVEDKEQMFGKLNLLLNCSLMEGFGRSIVEAMSRGIPVIAGAGGGIPEIIDDGLNSFLYHSEQELCDKMIRLFGDEKLYERISGAALEKSRQFSVETYASSIQNIFLKVVTA